MACDMMRFCGLVNGARARCPFVLRGLGRRAANAPLAKPTQCPRCWGMIRRLLFPVVAMLALAGPAAHAQPGIARPEDCLRPETETPGTTAQARVQRLLDRLDPMLAAMPSLGQALRQANPAICLSDHLLAEHGYMESDGARIVLKAELTDPMLTAILIHELRHLDQLGMGACPSPLLSAQETARSVFALEADASAVMMLGAWWLRENGDPAPWQAILAWPSARDIATRFASEIEQHGDTSRAMAAAFAQWYASDWRRTQYYLGSCSDYLDRQDRTKRLPHYQLMPPGYLADLCRLPDGAPYPCREPADATRH